MVVFGLLRISLHWLSCWCLDPQENVFCMAGMHHLVRPTLWSHLIGYWSAMFCHVLRSHEPNHCLGTPLATPHDRWSTKSVMQSWNIAPHVGVPQAFNHVVLPHAGARFIHHMVQSSWTNDGACPYDCDRLSIEELHLLAVKVLFIGLGDSTDGNEERVSGPNMPLSLLLCAFLQSKSLVCFLC